MSEIIIEDPILEKGRLTSRITTAKNLSKYISERELFIEYDIETQANESILNIPLTATVLPLAWLTGSDIYVKTLDHTFKESMDELQNFFAQMYPKGLFTTEIKTEKLVNNKIEVEDPERRTGMLFSGGVDSMYSLINNIQHNPRLVMIWGCDNFPYPERSDHWEKTISIYSEFARKKNLELNVIKTNISQILTLRRIEHSYHKELFGGRLRGALQHSLVLLPPAAPISFGRFDKFIIAATVTPKHDFKLYPSASGLRSDEKIIWADLSVKHDGYVDRFIKIKKLVDHYGVEPFTLRVCSRSAYVDGTLNDGKCQKCLITLMSLILADFDPNQCGFDVDESTFEFMKSLWGRKDWAAERWSLWKTVQESIPDQIDFDVHGSKEFFEWFREFDLDDAERNWFYFDLYMWLPYFLAKNMNRVFSRYGNALHQYPYNREYVRAQKQLKKDN